MRITNVLDQKVIEKMKFVHFRPYITKATKQGLLSKHFASGKTIEAALIPVPKGGVTLGYLIKDDKTIWVSATVCGKKDLFNRKKALSIVKGRMSLGKYEIIRTDTKNKENIYKALTQFISQ